MFVFNDFGYCFLGDGFDVGGVGYGWIGYDGGWVGVYQNYLKVFFVQGFVCLGIGVVEFVGLVDYDWIGVNDEDVLNISLFRYV